MKKVVLISFILFGANLVAQQCPTIWVYQPWATCRAANHPPDLSADLSGVPVEPGTVSFHFGNDNGGAGHGEAFCNNAQPVAAYNSSVGPGQGLFAVSSEFDRTVSDGNKLRTGYAYFCKLEVKKYPRQNLQSKECGTTNTWAYQKAALPSGLPGWPRCLSCDPEINTALPKDAANCLIKNITEIVSKMPVQGLDIRETDLGAMSFNANLLLEDNKRDPVLSIPDKETLRDFVSKHVPVDPRTL